jgi:hypothetical protein
MDKKLTSQPSQTVDLEIIPYHTTVVLLEKRLQRMRLSFEQRSQEVFDEFRGLPYNEIEQMSRDYTKLAHFTGLLAKSIDKNAAEISETDVSFGKRAPLDATLREYLSKGMEKPLIAEIKDIAGNYHDGDNANFLKQVELYTSKLRQEYRIEFRSGKGGAGDSWNR